MFRQRILKLFAAVVMSAASLFSTSAHADDTISGPLTLEKAAQLIFKQGLNNVERTDRDFSLPELLNAKIIDAPEYIRSKQGKPVLQVAVLNRTSLITDKLLGKVIDVVNKQVKKDFAPYYGILVKFHFFRDESTINWEKFVPLIITDLLLTDIAAIGFHDVQDFTGTNGDPISIWITNPPSLPEGTPYIIIPMGTPSTDYGVVPASLLGSPDLPPTFETIFSNVFSHEILETLANYAVNKVFRVQNGLAPNSIDFYRAEVCDPVEFNPGYIIRGFNVANFVLPSWFVFGLAEGPYDFLNTTPASFTPFSGEISITRASATPGAHLVFFDKVSLPSNPTVVFFTAPTVIFPFSAPVGLNAKIHNISQNVDTYSLVSSF